jgi:hypothetical protein
MVAKGLAGVSTWLRRGPEPRVVEHTSTVIRDHTQIVIETAYGLGTRETRENRKDFLEKLE